MVLVNPFILHIRKPRFKEVKLTTSSTDERNQDKKPLVEPGIEIHKFGGKIFTLQYLLCVF
jgi:hypothetical protein